ncbi:MAG TPA: M1 family metallopeptidase [Wenzhouxiangellaceae bacterium]|nr:M1 family metallopeptidase [Wenzhouxiangellaceae bacterium]
MKKFPAAPMLGAVLVVMLTACDPAIEPIDTTVDLGADPHSYANYEQVRIEHLALALTADFSDRTLSGHVTLDLAQDDLAERLVLDTWRLDVRDINRVGPDGELKPLSWRLADSDPENEYLGAPLIIAMERGVDRIRIDYTTSPDAFGLQWLDGQQTTSGEPFLFSQSQPIFARTWVPLQDTPAVRYTFDAEITVPSDLMAVMGAAGNPTEIQSDGVYEFNMPQPIPSYLMAIGVGKLEFEPTGPRSGVYAEPSLVDAAAEEFSELEAMIDAGEALYGPYRWDRYDLLILPPSFPFGGMENPRLSFITPTVIAGDKSLTALIAHELAHSWSGNLVTNSAWQDLWLNEGFTTYFENRIVEALYGPERAEMEATLDRIGLQEELKELDEAEQVLARDLSGQDPEQAFNGVPYDKGRLFLLWLEDRFGRETLDAFLRQYFDHFAFESIDTEEFIAYLEANLLPQDPDAVSMEQVREWIFEPGLPGYAVLPASGAFDQVDEWRRQWLDGEIELSEIPVDEWTVSEWRHFLLKLGDRLDAEQMAAMDAEFGLTGTGNVEILYLWLVRAIETRYEPGIERLEDFLLEVGRNKFTRPLYEELAATDWGREWAIDVYQRAKPGYHPLTRQAAERALGIASQENVEQR